MHFLEFQKSLQHYPIFSLKDVRKIFPNFSYRQMDRWEKKAYLKKIKQGFYSFSDQKITQDFLLYTANKIYPPSYISLENALKFYGLIPEEIFQITSVTTKKTTNFRTEIGNFSYRHLKPSLFWGYVLKDFATHRLLIAEPEKAILDYLYLNPHLKTADDFLGMRVNGDEFYEMINFDKLFFFLKNFDNQSLNKRTKLFLTTLENDRR